ncbi:hypothetical protein OXPF_18070 [Oxobacter pfennigii]|uniref:DUF2922 domain-containing protein n=1 Tax=Oxobacter pfennigii TaxID=36849 RepID=A0A0P8W9S2_9CLOT|nr:DUF2922 domain-containing protein [Oxobacter pfennigii]KPU44721.1 hypothetical protein OXPF_18070 [Oxobacter pfennigii]
MTEKTIVFIFMNQSGNNVRLTIENAREDVTDAEVRTGMETIIARNIFESSGGNLMSIAGAERITRTVEEFAVK